MSLQDWIRSGQDSPGVLTQESLDRMFEQMRNAPPDPCRLGRHVVSATALRKEWKYARCENCLGIVQLS